MERDEKLLNGAGLAILWGQIEALVSKKGIQYITLPNNIYDLDEGIYKVPGSGELNDKEETSIDTYDGGLLLVYDIEDKKGFYYLTSNENMTDIFSGISDPEEGFGIWESEKVTELTNEEIAELIDTELIDGEGTSY